MVSIFNLWGRAAFAACLFFVALSCPGHTDDYGNARTAFNRLSIDQRYETQALLGVAGYWPAVANDEFSHRLFEAITHFQADNGFPISGILTASQIDRARQIANPILAYWQLKPVRHPVTGLPLWVPFGVGFTQIRTRSGLDFETANKIAAISFNFFPNGDLRATHSNLLNVAGFRPVYSKLKDNFFAINTEGRGLNAYSRYQAIPEGIIGFTLSWTQDDAQNVVLHGERLVTLMSDLFRANIELGLPRSPPTPRPATAAALPHAQMPSPQTAIPPAPEGKKQDNQKTFGTGFFVSSEGHIITNSHVVKDCSSVQVTIGLAPKMAGRIIAHDAANDLALIKIEMHPTVFASLRSGIRLGEGVAAFGFPLAGLLATSGNFTLGNVTAVAGLGDDTRILQISAPVQPGNSGGPLLDYSGNVVGVVEGKLNAITVATVTNDMAQNVNFAIKTNVVTNFLDANSVAYTSGSLSSTALQTSEIAERAKSFTVMIECSPEDKEAVRQAHEEQAQQGAQMRPGLAQNPIEGPRPTIIAAFKGTCTAKLFTGWFPCEPGVEYMVLPNGRSTAQFEKGGQQFVFAGGHDRQPDINDLFLSIDRLRILKGSKELAVDDHMEGECHFVFNDDASAFKSVHCDAWDRAKGLTFFFHLDDITKTDHKTF